MSLFRIPYLAKNPFILTLVFLLPTAYARNYWASFYLNEATGIYGYSIDQDNDVTAGRLALNDCKKNNQGKAGKCVKIAVFANQCGAVAWSAKNKSGRGGVAEGNMANAEQAALKSCRTREKDPNCKVVASLCTSWETWEETIYWW